MIDEAQAIKIAKKFCLANGQQISSHPPAYRLNGHWFVLVEQPFQAGACLNQPPSDTLIIAVDRHTGLPQVPNLRLELAQQLRWHRQRLELLFQNSSVEQSQDTQGLLPVRGRHVEVRPVQPGLLGNMVGHPVNGVAMRRQGKYVIFLDDAYIPGSGGVWGMCDQFERRSVVLHEYAHFLNNDLFEECVWTVVRRRWFDPVGYQSMEDSVDCSAASRLIQELKAKGQGAHVISRLSAELARHGIVIK